MPLGSESADLTHRGLAATRAAARSIGHNISSPGPAIAAPSIPVGGYSPQTAALDAAINFAAGARDAANTRRSLATQRADQAYKAALTAHLEAETTRLGAPATSYALDIPEQQVAGAPLPAGQEGPPQPTTIPGQRVMFSNANDYSQERARWYPASGIAAARTAKVLDVGDLEKFGLPGHYLGRDITEPEVQAAIGNVTPKPPPGAFQQMLQGVDIPGMAQDIKEGRLAPNVVNSSSLRGVGPALATELHKQGVDSARLTTEWNAMQALTRNANTGQMANLQRAGHAVDAAVGNMESLNRELSTGVARGLWPALNKFSLQAARAGVYGGAAQQVARKYDAQIGVLRTEVPLVLSGGYAPQAPQIKDAHDMMLNADSEGGLAATLDVLKQNVGYKTLSIKSLGATLPGGATPSQYQWQDGAGAAPTKRFVYDAAGNVVEAP